MPFLVSNINKEKDYCFWVTGILNKTRKLISELHSFKKKSLKNLLWSDLLHIYPIGNFWMLTILPMFLEHVHVKTATSTWKKSPPFFQEPPLKVEILSSPLFWKFGQRLKTPSEERGCTLWWYWLFKESYLNKEKKLVCLIDDDVNEIKFLIHHSTFGLI